MKSIELEEIRLEHEILKKRQGLLQEREKEIWSHNQDARSITADETLMKSDIKPEEVNYVLGQSDGYVAGFKAAIDDIVCELSSEYRDIPMTESELYMLVELGAEKERAWLKDYKQKKIIETSGWEFDFTQRCPIWLKKEKSAANEKED